MSDPFFPELAGEPGKDASGAEPRPRVRDPDRRRGARQPRTGVARRRAVRPGATGRARRPGGPGRLDLRLPRDPDQQRGGVHGGGPCARPGARARCPRGPPAARFEADRRAAGRSLAGQGRQADPALDGGSRRPSPGSSAGPRPTCRAPSTRSPTSWRTRRSTGRTPAVRHQWSAFPEPSGPGRLRTGSETAWDKVAHWTVGRVGRPTNQDASSAASCGTRLIATRPACGTANAPSDRFCGECGAAIGSAETVTRELARPSAPDRSPTRAPPNGALVTILFADLVGFTTLAEDRDPEDGPRAADAATSSSRATSSSATAGRSRSSSATPSWPCGARRSPTRTTPSARSVPALELVDGGPRPRSPGDPRGRGPGS